MCDCAKKDPFAGDCCSHKKFDPTKPVQTRDGRKARIICTDKKSGVKDDTAPIIVALVDHPTGIEEQPYTYSSSGVCFSHRRAGQNDLVNVPERTYQYTNMFYSGEGFSKGGTFTEKELALAAKGYLKNYAFTIEHTFEDGKLIDSEVIR